MRKRGDAWESLVSLGNDPVTGKQRYQPRSVKGGKRKAEWVLAQLVAEAERGLTARTAGAVGDLLDAWFEFAERDLSPKTAMETRRVINGDGQLTSLEGRVTDRKRQGRETPAIKPRLSILSDSTPPRDLNTSSSSSDVCPF